MSDAPVVVMVSVPSAERAYAIAGALLDNRLAACVQALPMASTYRWAGKIERADEILLLIKTRSGRFGEIETLVRQLHPYDVPEIISLAADAIHGPYREWLMAETT